MPRRWAISPKYSFIASTSGLIVMEPSKYCKGLRKTGSVEKVISVVQGLANST